MGEIARGVVVRNDKLAERMQRVERRLGLDGELIERQMLGRLRDGALEFVGPRRRCLTRPRVNQVERIALEGCAGDLDRIERLLRGVQPAKLLQRVVVERLHAERNPVDARVAITTEPIRLDAGRVGFERDLGAGCDRPMLADGVENCANGLGLHQRRRAAAKKDA